MRNRRKGLGYSMIQMWKDKIREKGGKKHLIFWTVYWGITLAVILGHGPLLLGAEGREQIPYRLGFAGLLILWGVLVWICERMWVKNVSRREKKRIRIWHFLILFADAIYLFWVMEFVNNNQLAEMKFGYMALNVLGIFIIALIFLFWFNSFRRALMANTILFTSLSVAFYYVYSFRGEPLQLIDFFSFGTAMDVAGTYDWSFPRPMAVIVPLSLSLIVLILHLPDRYLARKKPGKIAIRLGVGAFMVFGYFFYLNVNWNGNLGIVTNLWMPISTYREYGNTVGFFCVAKYMRLTPPADYSLEKTEEIAEGVDTSENPNEGKVKPVNIIAIMSESWADYRMVGDLRTNEEVMPFYDSMKENTIKGHTLVCIRGGGTAKTEYEFLTGNSVKRFPSMVPYVSYFTHDQYSLVTTLEAQGYDSVAMHPNKGSNWKRTSAYRFLNFDTFYTIDDFDEDDEKVRDYISDQANFEKIIDVVESKENSEDPLFLFNVTMQNHGGYTEENYQGEIQVEGYNNRASNQYLSIIHESDKALEYLIHYFEDYPEPTLIVMFGDHYPTLPDSFTEYISGSEYDDLTLDEQEMYYATPFFIWANYDIPEEEGVLTSTNYLGTMMLEQTGLEMAPYNYYLQDLQETIPALNHLGYMDPEGKFHAWEDADEKTREAEWEYECLQYNNLAEKGRRLDWFFTVDAGEDS